MAEISTGQCLSTMQHDYQTGLYREREREAASNSQLDEQFSLFFLWRSASLFRFYRFSSTDLFNSCML